MATGRLGAAPPTGQGRRLSADMADHVGWQHRAECRDQPTELFAFDRLDRDGKWRRKMAGRSCAVCPVKVNCIQFVLGMKVTGVICAGVFVPAGGPHPARKKLRALLDELTDDADDDPQQQDVAS